MHVIILGAARRELHRLAPDVAERVGQAIDGLEENPRPAGCRLLRDRESRTWRLRVGHWRILYDIDDTAGVVTVLRILHRSKAY